MEYITIIYLLLLSAAQTLLGYALIVIIGKRLPASVDHTHLLSAKYLPFVWLFGLLGHLSLVFVGKSLGLPWWAATSLPFFIVGLALHSFAEVTRLLWRASPSLLSVPFFIWCALHLYLGLSLFTVDQGISTPWVNNYGDLAFHLGMIQHFVFVGDFPPNYHLYAGESLSYPFFVNLWTAVAYAPFKDITLLPTVFAIQWLLLWSCVYYFFSAGRAHFLPWILVLGGGSFFAIIQQPDVFSWKLISKGFPWTTWLSTIWVTQRSALLGLAVCAAALALVLNLLRDKSHGQANIVLAGGILAMSPIAHAHFFLVTTVFLGGFLFARVIQDIVTQRQNLPTLAAVFELQSSQRFLCLFIAASCAVFYFPLLLGKSGMMSLMWGWNTVGGGTGYEALENSAVMWLKNAVQWFVVFGVLWALSKQHICFFLLTLLFILANMIKMVNWEWDQLKVFLAIFTVFIAVWNNYFISKKFTRKWITVNYLLALFLIIPGTYEAWRVLKDKPNYEVYSTVKMEIAELIREHVPADAIVASATDHNSAATISGRKLYFGYPGTLSSHNIVYQPREQVQRDLSRIHDCQLKNPIDISLCPQYLVWDGAGQRYWHPAKPGAGFEKVATTRDGLHGIYKIVPNTVEKHQ